MKIFSRARLKTASTVAGYTFAVALWFTTWSICVYMQSDVEPPLPPPTGSQFESALEKSHWFDKKEKGINHAFLHGTAFERGLAWGKLSGNRLERQEKTLVGLYRTLIPNLLLRKVFELGIIRIFKGIENEIEPEMREEMWGVSRSAPAEFDYLASPYARQIMYHGLHEVGQLFVDFAPATFACTFVASPWTSADGAKKWIVGRTFDFEGGRVFDEEKVMKWVYPTQGYKYLSVIWTGMVGAVSGINEKGIFVTINAAGSKDFWVRGTPSTLLLAKVLQRAATADEALAIFRDTRVLIADIYMLLDSKAQRLYKIEKSARHLDIQVITGPKGVANHLESSEFKNDSFNDYRRDKLTSAYRQERAQQLADELDSKKIKSSEIVSSEVLKILRDKGRDASGQQLYLGNRRAIDALIAAHGVVYDSNRGIMYVGEGPAMSGKFRGYDIAKTFAANAPVEVAALAGDPAVDLETYSHYTANLRDSEAAAKIAARGRCALSRQLLEPLDNFRHFEKEIALWQLAKCEHDETAAQAAVRRALALSPPYRDTEEKLLEAIR